MPGNCDICSGYSLIPVCHCLVMKKLGYTCLFKHGWLSASVYFCVDGSNPAGVGLSAPGRGVEMVDKEVREKWT